MLMTVCSLGKISRRLITLLNQKFDLTVEESEDQDQDVLPFDCQSVTYASQYWGLMKQFKWANYNIFYFTSRLVQLVGNNTANEGKQV